MYNSRLEKNLGAVKRTARDLVIPFKWEDRKPILLEKFFYIPSHFEGHEFYGPLNWSDPALFGNDQPLSVEFCSGNGQWIAAQAKQAPHINWIAVEMDFERARKVWLKIFRQNLPNLIVVCGEALLFSTHYLAAKSVAEVYVNFPDPWPKRRHFKHRLIQSGFVQQCARVVKNGGSATLVTDDAPYSEEMIKQFSASPWKNAFAPALFETEWPNFGTSYFYSLWVGKQRTIRYHRYINE